MNAFLLLSTAWVAGADPVAAPAANSIVLVNHACGGSGCGGSSCCSGSCDSCGKPSLLDKIRARFAKNDCGCAQTTSCCEKAPKCKCERAPRCKPACGTPLFAGRDKGCCNSAPTCCNAAPACNTCDSCSKPSLLDKWRAKFASRKSDCCGSSSCCNSAPAGCSLPPAPNAAPAPTTPPQTMPKKSTSLTVPSDLTPASNAAPVVVPSVPMPAPAPTPVLGGSKSPY